MYICVKLLLKKNEIYFSLYEIYFCDYIMLRYSVPIKPLHPTVFWRHYALRHIYLKPFHSSRCELKSYSVK